MMTEKLQINVYKGLPMILEKVKAVAIAAVIGKTSAWMQQKLNHNIANGKPQEFTPEDLNILNEGIYLLGEEISQNMVKYDAVREVVIDQIKVLDSYISMPYIYLESLKKDRRWYANRMVQRKPGGKVCSFKEDDVLAINMAAMQIANELRSIEFTL